MLDKDKIKEAVTQEDIVSMITDFGGESFIVNENTLISSTLCHNHPADNPSQKLYYYSDNNLFRCYTGGCGGFDVFEMVRKLFELQRGEELSFPATVMYVADRIGMSFGDFQTEASGEGQQFLDSLSRILEFGTETVHAELKEYPHNIISNLKTYRIGDWQREGITLETLKRYKIRYHGAEQKIVIPHYDKKGRLVGVRGRTLIPEEEQFGKYMPLVDSGTMYNHPLGFNLYGLNLNSQNIETLKTAIVFESEKSVMIAESYLNKNIAVAVCGSNISNFQVQELLDLGVNEIIIAFDKQYKKDGDEESLHWKKKLKGIGDRYKKFVNISIVYDTGDLLGYKDAPIDCGKETFMKLLSERRMVY